ncbi:MAG: hypothetical protein H0U47_10350, partial [Nocardioidaceae bacterium]|nr:hypothetical protein [Nocardioidaceae bacterium]
MTLTGLVTAATWGGSASQFALQAVAGQVGSVDGAAAGLAAVPSTASSWVAESLVTQAGALSAAQASDDRPAASVDRPRRLALLARGGSDELSSPAVAVDGIPMPALAAYRNAESVLLTVKPSCALSWSVLAGIGRVESDHGRFGGAVVDRNGVSSPQIIGLPLNGVGPVAAIADTDEGRLDGDTKWDRAVGPLQFIPTTWEVVGSDGDGDDVRNPHDLDDAALAAAVYLCSGGEDLSSRTGAEAAVGRYNHSDEYVALVLAYARAYERGQLPPELELSTPPDVSSVPTIDKPVTQPPMGPALAEDNAARSSRDKAKNGNGPGRGKPNDPAANDPPGNDPPGNDPPGNDPPGNDPPGNDPPANDPPAND